MRDRKISEMTDEELRELMKKRRGKCHTGAANAAQRELWVGTRGLSGTRTRRKLTVL